jgi:hypothetical protein
MNVKIFNTTKMLRIAGKKAVEACPLIINTQYSSALLRIRIAQRLLAKCVSEIDKISPETLKRETEMEINKIIKELLI